MTGTLPANYIAEKNRIGVRCRGKRCEQNEILFTPEAKRIALKSGVEWPLQCLKCGRLYWFQFKKAQA